MILIVISATSHRKIRFASLIFGLSLFGFGCKSSQISGSRLAVDGGSESQFVAEACRHKQSMARYSRLRIDGREVLIMTKDFCSSKNSSDTNQLRLMGEPQTRKPVLIVDGYGGNAGSDKMVHSAVKDTQPWANENFRVLQIPPGASTAVAQRIISEDREKNPQDYSANSWVGLIQAAHGYVGEDGRHRTIKSDVSDEKLEPNQIGPTKTYSSYLTTQRAGALIEGIGHDTGSISCLFYQCQSAQIGNDPEFAQVEKSTINPEQKRVFQFSSAPDRSARVSPSIGANGGITSATTIEQSVGFLMQQAESDGLTVEEYQAKLNRANLGNVELDITTGFVQDPTATKKKQRGHFESATATPLFAPQAPSIVGPKDAFILPPGIVPDKHNPPIASRDEQLRSITDEAPQGTVFRDPIDDGAGPFKRPLPSDTNSDESVIK